MVRLSRLHLLWPLGLACLTACGAWDVGGGASRTAATTQSACGVDTWKNYAAEAMQQACVGCHQNLWFHDSAAGQADAIADAVANNRMPPAGLPSADKARLLAWLRCHTP